MKLYGGVRYIDAPCPANVRRLDHGALPLIHRMHTHGIRIDQPFLRSLHEEIATKKLDLEASTMQLVGSDYQDFNGKVYKPFNIGSPDQVARLLFDHLQVHKGERLRMTDSGKRPTTGDEVLELYKDNPIVSNILDWRELDKVDGTYVTALLTWADSDSRIHTSFSATTAATGRLASSKPNLQNIPIRTEIGKRVRMAFLAGTGRVLVSCDLSQIEMRWAAHLSQDPAMMEAFRLNQDIHEKTACTIFHLDLDHVASLRLKVESGSASPAETAWYRDFKQQKRLPSKVLGFRILYEEVDGKHAPAGLQTQIIVEGGPWWELEECAKLIADWYRTYARIRELMEEQYRRARRWGMVWDAFGRPRLVPEIYSAHRRIRGEGLRKAGNHTVQSSAQGTIKLAMAASLPIYDIFDGGNGCVCWPLLQIHDELISEVDKGQARDFADCQMEIMEQATPLSIPVGSSSDIAERWGELK